MMSTLFKLLLSVLLTTVAFGLWLAGLMVRLYEFSYTVFGLLLIIFAFASAVTWRNLWTDRKIGCVALGMVAGIIFLASIHFGAWVNLADYTAAPFISAPAVSFGVAVASLFSYILEEYNPTSNQNKADLRPLEVTLVCIPAGLLSLIACYHLATAHGWRSHLLWLVFMYGGFCAWDFFMLKVARSLETLGDVRITTRFVNWPTVVACAFVLLYLYEGELGGHWHLPDGVAFEKLPFGGRFPDAIAAGLVFFHLIVGAISYLTAAVLTKNEAAAPTAAA